MGEGWEKKGKVIILTLNPSLINGGGGRERDQEKSSKKPIT